MRKRIVAGNWKMNTLSDEALQLASDVADLSNQVNDVELILFPPSLYLSQIAEDVTYGNLTTGAQNCSQFENGAYTGEISAEMVASVGAEYCLVGHSERRFLYGETDEVVAAKFNSILKAGLVPVLCVGEQLEERKYGDHQSVVADQLNAALKNHLSLLGSEFVVAYEPVWAIGTGETASPEQAQEMHAFIRSQLNKIVGDQSEVVTILYGGSCKPTNARELFANPDVDGGLIGGASLDADSFIQIAQSFS